MLRFLFDFRASKVVKVLVGPVLEEGFEEWVVEEGVSRCLTVVVLKQFLDELRLGFFFFR
jgi:hypothetical protein